MWSRLAAHFADEYCVLLMDHVGTAEAGVPADYDSEAYLRPERYAEDVIAVAETPDLRDVALVGHSVSAMICGLATKLLKHRVRDLVMIGPSPYYLDDGDYRGGVTAEARERLALTLHAALSRR